MLDKIEISFSWTCTLTNASNLFAAVSVQVFEVNRFATSPKGLIANGLTSRHSFCCHFLNSKCDLNYYYRVQLAVNQSIQKVDTNLPGLPRKLPAASHSLTFTENVPSCAELDFIHYIIMHPKKFARNSIDSKIVCMPKGGHGLTLNIILGAGMSNLTQSAITITTPFVCDDNANNCTPVQLHPNHHF